MACRELSTGSTHGPQAACTPGWSAAWRSHGRRLRIRSPSSRRDLRRRGAAKDRAGSFTANRSAGSRQATPVAPPGSRPAGRAVTPCPGQHGGARAMRQPRFPLHVPMKILGGRGHMVHAGDMGGLLVGREAEVAELRGFLRTARTGQAPVVFVAGEAGVGKTALVEHVLARVGAAGAGAAGSGTAEAGLAGSGSAGSGTAEAGLAGSGSAGSGTAEAGPAGSGSAGSGTAGAGLAGSGAAGSGTAGAGLAGSGAAGSGT